jgi:hypothetical protein
MGLSEQGLLRGVLNDEVVAHNASVVQRNDPSDRRGACSNEESRRIRDYDYGRIKVANAPAQAFDCSVNDLPLTIVLSWFERNAVAVLLTLLWQGIRGIRIGPAAPAFITPNEMSVLREEFRLRLTNTNPIADLNEALATSAA